MDGLSTDKGFWSPEVYAYLRSKLELVAIPKNGSLNKEEKEPQGSAAFVHARNQHPGTASAINGLQHRGLKRVPSYGSDGFARTVGSAVGQRADQEAGQGGRGETTRLALRALDHRIDKQFTSQVFPSTVEVCLDAYDFCQKADFELPKASF